MVGGRVAGARLCPMRAGSGLSSTTPSSRNLQQAPQPLGLGFLLCEGGTAAAPTPRDKQHRAARQAELLSPSILASLTGKSLQGPAHALPCPPTHRDGHSVPARLWEQVTWSGRNKALGHGGYLLPPQNPVHPDSQKQPVPRRNGTGENRSEKGSLVTRGGRSLGY